MTKKLDPDFCRVIAALFREYSKFVCEAMAAKAMLKESAERRIPIPVLWEDALRAVKEKSELAELANNLEKVSLQLETDAAETDVIELLKRVPVKTPIN